MKSTCTFFVLLLFVFPSAFSSHLLGGEIRTSHISGQTFKISVHVYFDLSSGSNGAIQGMQNVPVCFGDGGTADLPRIFYSELPDKKYSVGIFEQNYTYPSSGTFQIAAKINNRSGMYLNMPNAEMQPSFLWTTINTQVVNTSPILAHPILEAGVRQLFTVDLKPTVTDQDSVSVRLQLLSKASPGLCGVRSVDDTYFFPNDLTKSGTFKVDNVAKTLTWTAPEKIGRYLYAFVVMEWRDGIVISESYHEGSIFVSDKPGEKVEIPDYEPAGALVTSVPNVDSPEISIAMDAYPVPTEDYLTFRVYSKKRSTINVQLVNLQGKVVREVDSASAELLFEHRFDMRHLAKGVYVIRALNDKDFISQKVVR